MTLLTAPSVRLVETNYEQNRQHKATDRQSAIVKMFLTMGCLLKDISNSLQQGDLKMGRIELKNAGTHWVAVIHRSQKALPTPIVLNPTRKYNIHCQARSYHRACFQ